MKKLLLKKRPCLLGLCAAFAVTMLAPSVWGAPADDSGVYSWQRKATPNRLRPYSATVYTGSNFDVCTMRGDILLKTGKDTIVSFDMNPAGINFIAVTKGKKKSAAGLYEVTEEEYRISKFDKKKFGIPYSATFTPDARSIIVATDRAIYVCDARTLKPARRLANATFVPDAMVVSGNGYFLAVISGDKCVVYNLESGSVRKELSVGEKITDVAFSPDNSDMAVLTADGVLTLYGTRTFEMRKMVDNLGEGLAMAYNLDGKYMAVAESSSKIEVVNLLNDSDREQFEPVAGTGVSDVAFVSDANQHTLMVYPAVNTLEARRLMHLKPYYNKLISDETEEKMAEWLKMMPGETMDEYRARVNDESRAKRRVMFEYEIATRLAGNLIGSSAVSLGSYDRTNGVLAINFESMPTIYLPVPENEVTAFRSGSDVILDEVLYGVNPDDSFEIVYAKVTNRNNDKTYVFDNLGRAAMKYMDSDDAISLETLQQQQMEELRLQELRQKVVEEAKQRNVISDHTNITVDSRIVPEYDADGKRILNYLVRFSYDVSPGFSVQEDFGPGKYHVEESGAATSMLKIVKEAFDGELSQYLSKCKKMRVSLTGTADATPIVHGIPYDGSYGNFDNEPVYADGQLSAISVNSNSPIKENLQLAFLRAIGVKDYLEKNVEKYNSLDKDYRYEINVSSGKGSEFRRITAAITFVDAF